MAYPLPRFASRILAERPAPPRPVPALSLLQAVLSGVDCSIYVIGAVALVVFGVAVVAHALPSASPAGDVAFGRLFVGLGILCAVLPSLRLWQVSRALRHGDARIADVVEAEVGSARLYGTPWGEPMFFQGRPIAAKGTYRFADTGESGRYYMQQWWATALRPGAQIWVLRRGRRDVLYAPVAAA